MKCPLALLPLLLAACTTQTPWSGARPRVVQAANDAELSVLIERMKTLAGSWEENAPEGKLETTFSVCSAGSAVREIMFPGTAHEMTNMYHMDGDTLVMTHYCAAGNQPRMRAYVGRSPNELRFECDGVSNLRSADETYMGSMTLTFVDQDHVTETWHQYKRGEKGEPMVFALTRKR